MSSAALCEWKPEAIESFAWDPETDPFEAAYLDAEMHEEVERVLEVLERSRDVEGDDISAPKAALKRATVFMRLMATRLAEFTEESIPVPDIDLGPRGSIDLHWKRAESDLLVNIPAEPNAKATFYGDDASSNSTKGMFDPNEFEIRIAVWLMS